MAKQEHSKRTKINMKSIFPEGIEWKPIDMNKVYEESKKRAEADEKRYKKELKIEELRFKKLACPACKSTKKDKNTITHREGPVVYGGRNSVQILAEYCICQNCGIMYVDLKKKDIVPPQKSIWDHSSF